MNRENPGVDNAQVFRGLANLLKPDKANENPGALAGATGAGSYSEAAKLPEKDTVSLAARHPIIATHWGIAA